MTAADPLFKLRAEAREAWQSGESERCLAAWRQIADIAPTSEHICNVAVVLRSMGHDAEARSLLLARAEAIVPSALNDLLCSTSARLGDAEQAARYGTEALRLKDEAAPPAPPLIPLTRPFDPDRRGRNIISFSLWGSDPRYVNGAITNAQVARYLYPAWTPRFYVDGSVPTEIRDRLFRLGAQVLQVGGLPAARFGTFWRFLVEEDREVDFYLVRDADAVSNIREASAVAEWLGSGAAFHVMRDSLQHAELILAGMWGAHRGNIPEMSVRFRRHLAASPTRATKTLDQEFLRNEIWPIARQSLLAHDGYFDFMAPRRFDPAFPLPTGMGVGQNEAARLASGPIPPPG